MSDAPEPFGIAVLVGGRGARIGGRVKPLLRTRSGRTILEAILSELAPLGGGVVLVAPADLAPKFSGVMVDPVIVEDEGKGPAHALAAVAAAVRWEWILLVGGDMPRVSASLARRLLSARGRDAVAVEGEPLFALYRRAALGTGPASSRLADWLARLDAVQIRKADLTAEERAAFDDVDTPADLARL